MLEKKRELNQLHVGLGMYQFVGMPRILTPIDNDSADDETRIQNMPGTMTTVPAPLSMSGCDFWRLDRNPDGVVIRDMLAPPI